MRSTLATIIGTAALGFLKRKIGSSVKIKKQDYPIFLADGPYLNSIAANTDGESLGIHLDSLAYYNIQERDALQNNNRLILFPINDSKILKSAGLYIRHAEESNYEEGSFYLEYDYAFEPMNKNISEKEVKTEIALFHDQVQSSIRQAIRHIWQNTYIQTIYDEEEIGYDSIGDDEIINDLTQEDVFLNTIPLYVYEDNEGNQHRIPHKILDKHISKLRKK